MMKGDFKQPAQLGFNVSPRFSQLIGRHLISNPTVAVLELVKNSYDADAENITVTFEKIKTENGKIIIEDDGDGMTLDDIINKWMVIGTDNKLHQTLSHKGRRKLGEKGIGRFSVERLSKKTTIITKNLNNDQLITIEIDWDKYETEESFFNEITHPVKYEAASPQAKGTIIILENLRDTWTEETIANLRKELFLLIPLDIGKLSSKFKSEAKVVLKCDEFPNKSGQIEEKLLQYYHAKLFGEIYEDGSGKLELELRLNKKNSLKEVGVKYERKLPREELNYSCGPVVFEAYAFLRDGRLYRGLEINKDNITKLLDEYSGIKIYRDDFRVKPYGDPNNDWLNLNGRRIQDPEYRLSTSQVIGGVKISRDDNPGLQDVLSRENLYDTQEFKDLSTFINSVFDYYNYASFVENRDRKKEIRDTRVELYTKITAVSNELKEKINKGLKNLEDQKSIITPKISNESNYPNNNTNSERNIQQFFDKVTSDFNAINILADTLKNDARKATAKIKESDNFRNREIQIYRNIASLGISAAQFGHETAKLILNSVLTVRSIKRFEEVQKISNKNLQDEFVFLEGYLVSANQKADFFRGYLMREKQENKDEIDIVDIFKDVVTSFQKSFEEIKVSVAIDDKTNGKCKIMGYYGDIESIVTNIMTNAYKALTQGGSSEKLFNISFSCNDENLIITTINSGRPIEPEDRMHIFNPLFSTHKHGTGLGLSIIEDTLKLYAGSIQLLDDYPETKFEILIPLLSEVVADE